MPEELVVRELCETMLLPGVFEILQQNKRHGESEAREFGQHRLCMAACNRTGTNNEMHRAGEVGNACSTAFGTRQQTHTFHTSTTPLWIKKIRMFTVPSRITTCMPIVQAPDMHRTQRSAADSNLNRAVLGCVCVVCSVYSPYKL